MHTKFTLVYFFTILISVNLTSAGLFDYMKSKTICRWTECCNSDYVYYDINHLKYTLSRKVFGQPLVSQLVHILNAHKASFKDDSKVHKAEVLSFHGWSGVGKNYVATMIADSLYKNGMNSRFVRMYQGQKALESGEMSKSAEKLIDDITSTIIACPTSLIIFDEVDDMDPLILDEIKFMMDHHVMTGIDFSKALFVFISNIAGGEISDQLLNLYNQGYKREDLEFHHFEPIIRKTSYFEGGFKKSAIIMKNIIDHYIPFLPLEQTHVEQCVKQIFNWHGVTPTPEMWQDALSVITYGPTENQPIFSNTGCKRLPKHIPYIIEKHLRKTEL